MKMSGSFVFLYSERRSPRCVNSSQIAGKTATVRYIAKMINEGNVPEVYRDKILSERHDLSDSQSSGDVCAFDWCVYFLFCKRKKKNQNHLKNISH